MLVLVLVAIGGGIVGNVEVGSDAQLLSMPKPELGKLLWGCEKGMDEAVGISGGSVPPADGAFIERKSESSSNVTHFWVCVAGTVAGAGTKDCCLEKDGGRVEL